MKKPEKSGNSYLAWILEASIFSTLSISQKA